MTRRPLCISTDCRDTPLLCSLVPEADTATVPAVTCTTGSDGVYQPNLLCAPPAVHAQSCWTAVLMLQNAWQLHLSQSSICVLPCSFGCNRLRADFFPAMSSRNCSVTRELCVSEADCTRHSSCVLDSAPMMLRTALPDLVCISKHDQGCIHCDQSHYSQECCSSPGRAAFIPDMSKVLLICGLLAAQGHRPPAQHLCQRLRTPLKRL